MWGKEKYSQLPAQNKWNVSLIVFLTFLIGLAVQGQDWSSNIGFAVTSPEVPPLVRGPYLQNIQTDNFGESEITIRWRVEGLPNADGVTFSDGNYQVCYKAINNNVVKCIDQSNKKCYTKPVYYRDRYGYYYNGFDYFANLTNLNANTTYQYWVEGKRCLGRECPKEYGYFDTPPVRGSSYTDSNPLKVWVLGDSGSDFYCSNTNTDVPCENESVRDGLLKCVDNYEDYFATYEHPDFFDNIDLVMMLGDNAYGKTGTSDGIPTYEGGSDVAHQVKVFDKYKKLLKYKTFWPTLGNHEVDHQEAIEYYKTFSTPASDGTFTHNGEVYSRGHYSFDYGNVHFVSINSEAESSEDPDPTPIEEIAEWLKQDIHNARIYNNAKWVIVYCHHPIYTSGRHEESEPDSKTVRDHILPVIDSLKVDLVLTGHNHHYERSYLVKGFHGGNLNDCEDDYTSCWFRENNNGSLVFQECYFDDFLDGNGDFTAYCGPYPEACTYTPAFSYNGFVQGLPFLSSPSSGGYWADPVSQFPGYAQGKAAILDYGYSQDVYYKNDAGTVYVVAGSSSKVTQYPVDNYNCPNNSTEEYFFHHPLMKQFRDGYSDPYYHTKDGGRGLSELGSMYLEVTDDKLQVKFIAVDELTSAVAVKDSFIICKSNWCQFTPFGGKTDEFDQTQQTKDIQEASISVNPNPVRDHANIQLFTKEEFGSFDEGTLYVWDANGNQHIEQIIDLSNQKWRVATDFLENGMYIVEIHTDREVYSNKFLKMK